MVSKRPHVKTNLVAEEALATEIFDSSHVIVVGSPPPTSKCVVNRQEIRIFWNAIRIFARAICPSHLPTLKWLFARSASASAPNGIKNGDLEESAAAIVKAGSRQRNIVAINKNFPRWTSVGSLLSNLPKGVISSVVVNALTCKSGL